MRHKWLLTLSVVVATSVLLVYFVVFPAVVSKINSLQSTVPRVHISVEVVTKENFSTGTLKLEEIQFHKLVPVGHPPGWNRLTTQAFGYSYGSLTVWYTLTEYSYSGFERYVRNVSRLIGKRLNVTNPVRGYVVLVDTSSVPDLAIPLLDQIVEKDIDKEINKLAKENSLEITRKYQEGNATVWKTRAVVTVSSETQEIPVYIKAETINKENAIAIAIVTYPSGTVTATDSHEVGRLSITVSGKVKLDYKAEADEFLNWVPNCDISDIG